MFDSLSIKNTMSKNGMIEAKSFNAARSALVDILGNLTFLSVVSIQISKIGFHGEAIELKPDGKMVFFDKFGRNRSGLTIGPIQLIEAPMGPDHASSVPSTGDVLVGSLVPNSRAGSLKFVLRGWSSNAKPLKELHRLLKYGTKFSEFECRAMLLQSSCLLPQCPEIKKKCRDDIYMTARIILWCSLRQMQVLCSIQNPNYKLKVAATSDEIESSKNIRISRDASEFMDLLILKVNDVELSEAFTDGLIITIPEPVEAAPFVAPVKPYPEPGKFPVLPSAEPKPALYGYGVRIQDISEYKAPEYDPFQPISKTPEYAPGTPIYSPKSPQSPYHAESPMRSESPPYRPKSPTPEYASPVRPKDLN